LAYVDRGVKAIICSHVARADETISAVIVSVTVTPTLLTRSTNLAVVIGSQKLGALLHILRQTDIYIPDKTEVRSHLVYAGQTRGTLTVLIAIAFSLFAGATKPAITVVTQRFCTGGLIIQTDIHIRSKSEEITHIFSAD
jgi:hypothetical protein